MFYKKGVLKISKKFTGKRLYRSHFLYKVTGLRPATYQKETPTQVFSSEFCEVFEDIYFEEHLVTAVSQEKTHQSRT